MRSNLPEYKPNRWVGRKWHRPEDSRCYQVELKQNLFGDWVLVRYWGSLYRRGGQRMENIYNDYDEAYRQMEAVRKQRTQRGYVERL